LTTEDTETNYNPGLVASYNIHLEMERVYSQKANNAERNKQEKREQVTKSKRKH